MLMSFLLICYIFDSFLYWVIIYFLSFCIIFTIYFNISSANNFIKSCRQKYFLNKDIDIVNELYWPNKHCIISKYYTVST